jgi:negative regulator of sigma E activity
MHDPWLDRLSEYIDGELAQDDVGALERHLGECDTCAATLTELRSVVEQAHALEDAPPEHDLWSGIADEIGARRTTAGADVVPLRWQTAARLRAKPGAFGWRRLSFTVPELAAAALVLVSASAGVVLWLAGDGRASETMMGEIAHTATDAGAPGRLVTTTPADERYDADIARLGRALEDAREQLDPATVDVIERSLESIDQAIADARTALAADPGNPFLTRHLDNTMRTKLDVLRRVNSVQRVGT